MCASTSLRPNTDSTSESLPVFWGSLLGVVLGSIISGVGQLKLVGDSPSTIVNPLVVVFCVLLCIRFYLSIVFLTYDTVASPRVAALEAPARRAIFLTQVFLILGCSLNISFLSVLGGLAATTVIVIQATFVVAYWRYLWKVHFRDDPQAKFRVVIFFGDLTILVAALCFLAWELKLAEYNETGAGMLLGAILFVFLVECATNYSEGVRRFMAVTLGLLRERGEGSRSRSGAAS